MASIQVDWDVYKALTVLRRTEEQTENDVLRELLHLDPVADLPQANGPDADGVEWFMGGSGFTSEGVKFPNGTELRATFKGRTYEGKIDRNSICFAGVYYRSFSQAARKIAGYNMNGWHFWECRMPGQTVWKRIDAYRGS